MYRAKITSKGQLTLPRDLRIRMGLKAGDYLQIKETGEGYVLEKVQDDNRFHRYAGLLQREGDSDRVVKELRGE